MAYYHIQPATEHAALTVHLELTADEAEVLRVSVGKQPAQRRTLEIYECLNAVMREIESTYHLEGEADE